MNFTIFTWNLDQALTKGTSDVDLDSDSVNDSALCGSNSFYLDKVTELEHLTFLPSNKVKVS